MVMLPCLHQPKEIPISIFVPCLEEAGDFDGGNLYIMDKRSKTGELGNNQFEAFIYCHYRGSSTLKSWTRQILPPPLCIYDRAYLGRYLEISSYALLGDGSNICISVKGVWTCGASHGATSANGCYPSPARLSMYLSSSSRLAFLPTPKTWLLLISHR